MGFAFVLLDVVAAAGLWLVAGRFFVAALRSKPTAVTAADDVVEVLFDDHTFAMRLAMWELSVVPVVV